MQANVRKGLLSAVAAVALTSFVLTPQAVHAGSKGLRLKAPMVNAGVDPNAKGVASLREEVDRTDFKVEIQKIDPGTYDLLVAGAFQASLVVGDAERAEVEFRTNPEPGENKIPLSFDPRGQLVEVAQGATVFLSVVFPEGTLADAGQQNNSGKNKGKNKSGKDARVEIEVNFVSTGDLTGAQGKIRFRSRNGRQLVSAEIEDVPDGTYSLLVDGLEVGIFEAEAGLAELEFDTRAKKGKLPLTFDPRGLLVEVVRDGVVILQVVFPQA